MNLKDLIPSFGRKTVPVRREEEHPLLSLHRDMNRLFDGFLQDWDRSLDRPSGFTPRVDMTEDGKAFTLTAELPGMTDKDIEVSLTKDLLTIRGEKRNERLDERSGYYYSERTYGSFSRTVRLPREILADKMQADFRKGVLTVTLPKTTTGAPGARKIAIQAG